jgi:hypothetical protein
LRVRCQTKLRERTGNFSFADAGWSEEQERTNRAQRILQAGARSSNRTRQRRDRRALRNDALVKLEFDAQQLLRLFFFSEVTGMPVQRAITSSTSSRVTSAETSASS